MKQDKKEKQTKTIKAMVSKQQNRSKHLDVGALEWYKGLCEDIKSTIVETVYQAQQSLLEGKLSIGEAINKQKSHIPVTELVQYLAVDLKISERELWYCAKFFEDYKRIKKQVEGDKSMSWNKVKLLLAENKAKAANQCAHPHFTMIKICDDCGAKIKED